MELTNSNEHCLLCFQPPHRCVVQKVINPIKLDVHLEGDIGEVLVLLLRIPTSLGEKHVNSMHPEHYIPNAFHVRVYKLVDTREQNQDETWLLLRVYLFLQRIHDYPHCCSTIRALITVRRRQLRRLDNLG